MSKPAQPYSLQPGQGWTYDIGIEMTAKVGELGQGRRVAVTEYLTRAMFGMTKFDIAALEQAYAGA